MTVPSTTAKTASQTAATIPGATSAASTAATTAATAASAATSTTDSFTNPSSTLNQADFLKLLVAQIQYQDPMNPQSDTQMASQMAQFTTLQQTTQSTNSLAMMQANSLIGSTVGVQIDSTHAASGTVTGVDLSSGTPQIIINSTDYSLSQVTSVTPPSANSTTGATTPATPSSSDGTTTPTTQTTN
jgi:flagellar basal-body rod modification protein FlgD